MDKPEALRLAESAHLGYRIGWQRQAAAELRRLHVENKLLAGAADILRVAWRDEVHNLMKDKDQLQAQRDALLEALKTYGWHTEDCPQYPTHARPKNWPACTCGFDAAVKAV